MNVLAIVGQKCSGAGIVHMGSGWAAESLMRRATRAWSS